MPNSIFDNPDNKMSSKSMQWKTIGDKLEGTYIGKRPVLVQDMKNLGAFLEKTIYEIKTAKNEYYIVWEKPGIKVQMDRIKLGQIVGFEYAGDKPNPRPGFSPTKTIIVWADPKIIDEEWIKNHQEEVIEEPIVTETNEPTPDESGVDSTETNEPTPDESGVDSLVGDPNAFFPDEQAPTTNSIVDEINRLAMLKLGVVNVTEVPAKVMEKTGVAYIEVNFPKILEALKQL